MAKLLMLVFNNLSKDARVQRAANAISECCELTVLSCGYSQYNTNEYNSVVLDLESKSNIKKYAEFVKKTVSYAFKNRKFEVIYAHDFYSALPALIMKVLFISKKLVYDAHELYIPYKGYKFSLRDYFFYLFEKIAIKKADLVICAQEKRGELMKQHYKLKSMPLLIKNISLLPTIDTKIDEILDNKINNFFAIKAVTVAYAGVLSTERNIGKLVEAVNTLGKGYKLLIIGSGDDEENINESKEHSKNEQILMAGSISYSKLAYLLARCDIGYLAYPVDCLNNIYCAPNKIYEYASVGLAMVAPYNPTVDEEFKKYSIGITDYDIVRAIKCVNDRLDEYKTNSRRLLEYSRWENEANLLKKHIEELIKTL